MNNQPMILIENQPTLIHIEEKSKYNYQYPSNFRFRDIKNREQRRKHNKFQKETDKYAFLKRK